MSHMTNSSGGSRYVFFVIKELSKKHNVTLFLQKPLTFLEKEFENEHIEVIYLSDCSTGDLKFWLTFPFQIKKQIRTLIKVQQNFDVVISSMFPMNILGNSINLPHVQQCFQPFAFFWDKILISKLPLSQRIFLTLMRQLYGKLDLKYTKKSDIVSAPILSVCKYIKEFYNKDAIPVYGGVNPIFKPTLNNQLSNKFKDKKILIHSTDWTFTKNTNWLIEQFGEISKSLDNIVLLITEVKTFGKERDLAIKKIQSDKLNVELCGLIEEELLPSYMTIADIGIYPGVAYKKSAASQWVLECLACGTPVIRTNNTDEEVVHNQTGYLFDISKPLEFQNYVKKLLLDDSLRQEFSINAHKFVSHNRTWEITAKLYEQNCFLAIEKSQQ